MSQSEYIGEENVHSRIIDMTVMQSYCNNVAVLGKPNDNLIAWVFKVQEDLGIQQIAYGNALMVEAGEFLTEYGYKWWKKTYSSIERAKLELVDMLHFMLSIAVYEEARFRKLSSGLDDAYHEEIGGAISDRIEDRLASNYEEGRVSKHVANINLQAANFQLGNIVNVSSMFESFFYCCKAVGFSFTEMYEAYVGKNALNIFRYTNGFFDGTYNKQWNIDGVLTDDSEVVQNVIDEMKGKVNIDDVYNRLDDLYEKSSGQMEE